MSLEAKYFVTAISSSACYRNLVTLTSLSARNLVTEISSWTYSRYDPICSYKNLVTVTSLATAKFWAMFIILVCNESV